jgi:hypothetical protein
MIIIKLQGGLGNQLFQYAFGRFLEAAYGKEVAYDDTFYKSSHRYTKRAYALDFFSANVRIADISEIEKVKYPFGMFSRGAYFLRKGINKFFTKKYLIGHDEPLNSYVSKKDNLYMEGWWQTYKYADRIREKLLEELVPKNKPGTVWNKYVEEMHHNESVFVHIRRGDYLQGGASLQVLQKEYYGNAINYIRTHVTKPKFFIFSDDILWVKEHMEGLFTDAVFVDNPILHDEEVFMLMSECKHSIIANSSFSWWAAYLNAHTGKIVITPKKWQNAYMPSIDELCPPDWIRL